MVPGILPLISNWPGEVTIASATFELVSDTRVIGVPTFRMAECPTVRLTLPGSISTAAFGGGAAAAPDAAAAVTAATGFGAPWAQMTVVLPAMASRMMRLP